jgi:hypothetical protein
MLRGTLEGYIYIYIYVYHLGEASEGEDLVTDKVGVHAHVIVPHLCVRVCVCARMCVRACVCVCV